jgi:hypothetical protein
VNTNRKIISFIASVVFFLGASLGFAENEVWLKGTVVRIDGNKVTIRDVGNKETVLEGLLAGIKVGDPVLVKGQLFKFMSERTVPSAQDTAFLTGCLVERSDVDVIPRLGKEARDKIFLWIDSGDCEKLKPFKATREFLKKYTPPPDTTQMPPKGYDRIFLTAEESEYINDINKRILDKAFEDFGTTLEKR